MKTNARIIGILGASGFVGRNLLDSLSANQHKLRVFVRHKFRSRELNIYPNIEVVELDFKDEQALTRAIADCDTIINLIGILHEDRFGKENTFQNIHVNLVRKIIKACNANNVRRLIHISAINADPVRRKSKYLSSKGEGENMTLVQTNKNINVTVLKPSIIFGADDSFINMFADILRLPLVVFPLACPDFKLSPIAVEDVTDFIINSLDDEKTYGKAFNLCGKETYSLLELINMIKSALEKKTLIIGLPKFLSKIQAAVLGVLPGKMFTLDNFYSLQHDATCENKENVLTGSHSLKASLPAIVNAHEYRDRFSRYRKHDNI